MRLMLMAILGVSFHSINALAQQLPSQPDAAKLAPYYQQQRNIAYDNVAQCAASLQELRARIAELEKQLSEAGIKPK